MLLVSWVVITGLLFLICLAAYRTFAVNFAVMVYRDYSNAHLPASNVGGSSDGD